MTTYPGERNPAWRGTDASYQAKHMRVYAARGRPSECESCGQTTGRMEWACVGDYDNVYDYRRMCVPCHRRMDANARPKIVRVKECAVCGTEFTVTHGHFSRSQTCGRSCGWKLAASRRRAS